MGMATDRRTLLSALPALAVTGMAPAAQAAEISDIPKAEFVYEALVTLGEVQQAGQTPSGRRVRIPITGGTFDGPHIRGTILPSGEDWQLVRPDGFTVLEASYWLRTDDGALIHIVNKGLVGRGYGRTTPWFEAPDGPHGWLNEAVFAGTLAPVAGRTDAVTIRVFKLV